MTNQPKPKCILFRPTGEFREVRDGELYSCYLTGTYIQQWTFTHASTTPYYTFTRHEIDDPAVMGREAAEALIHDFLTDTDGRPDEVGWFRKQVTAFLNRNFTAPVQMPKCRYCGQELELLEHEEGEERLFCANCVITFEKKKDETTEQLLARIGGKEG